MLASAEHDLVLDGVDEVLNRPVSILVASPDNASQVAMSAREIATGEREGNVQVLDLGNAEGNTYLVTNQAEAADLLDLVIQQDAPYVEPFFTETLGSEIFGQARSTEPQYYEDEEDWEEEEYHEEESAHRPSLRERLSHLELPRFGRGGQAGAAGAAAAGAAAPGTATAGAGPDTDPQAAVPSPHTSRTRPVPPQPAGAPRAAAAAPAVPAPPAGKPKVTLWTDSHPDTGGIQVVAKASPSDSGEYVRRAAAFPAAARPAAAEPAGPGYTGDEDYDRDEENHPRSPRLLVGGVLAALLVAAIVVAVSQLNVFRGAPTANEANSPAANETAAGAPAEEGEAAVVEPEIAGLSRLVPDMPELDQENDGKLPEAIDGNPATYWASYQYATEAFGGYASNMALVVELEEASTIESIRLTQLSGRGGQFSVLLNDEPSLEGAKQVARGSFTAQNTTIPVPEEDGQAPKAQYVIVNFTQLPQLSNPGSAPPFGLRMAEIEVS
ncbi:ABC transporter substrate-binding protein [Arthrobacter mobilis]|uniref:ABC transporter substrate-binding protein n=1 Tax=Arthrobacter mobilis TaxID=2724944 RepID=UPI0028AB5C83|nr:ABC transporter substrate-binding protein [Arthrobacter mobilis]